MPVRLIAHEEPLPGYRLIERLGRGGFGEVWKCEAPGGLLKAIKFVFGDLEACDEESRPAEQELKALKRVQGIRHPYVLSLERYDILEGQLIIVMELADRNLWDRFRECRSQGLPGIPRDELLRYMEEAAEALDLMNNHYQIQHLDIQPQNLFVVFNHVKVGDFGLAKLLEGVRATVTGGVTPVYAAPETFEGWVSRFSDQYSLAIVFQELLTGTRPFNGANTRQLLMQHINGTPEMSALPHADRPVIGRALAKKPDDRWPTCQEMVRELKLSGLVASSQTPPPSSRVSPAPPADTAATRPAGFRGISGNPPREGTNLTKVQTPQPANSPAFQGFSGQRTPSSGSGSTPMPALVTVGPTGLLAPRLITPGVAAASMPTPAITLQRPAVFQTGRMNTLGIAPPERTGDGALFPALVIAIGETGRLVLNQLKHVVRDHFGSMEKVSNVRCLCIDTDPEALAQMENDPHSARDMVPMRLNRPAHYLQHGHLPPLDVWMPQGLLYKLPRVPASAAGVRAFGRLALLDNYKLLVQRIRQELEAFLTDEPLATAELNTGLGLRSNRPRVYILTGLGGGTGGGMFLDLAFLVRHELRSVGYLRPEVVGLFFTPPADRSAPRNTALGNTFAALTELHHYQSARTRYQTTFDKTEAPIIDQDAPFARMSIFRLSKKQNPKDQAHVAGLAARGLFNEILTTAGRVSDEVRDVYCKAYPSPHPICQSFGLYRLSWPRPEMLAASTRRFAQRILQRWMGKDAAHLQEPIAGWLSQQWAERRLNFDQVVAGFQEAVHKSLREDSDRVFDAFIDPLRTRTPSGGKMDAAAACTVLDQLIKVVGKPPARDDASNSSLFQVLSEHYEIVVKEAEVHVATMAVSFIEQPLYRLAGAEEAIRQIADKLKQQVDALAPLHQELDKEVRSIYTRLFHVIGNMGGGIGWKVGASTEVIDLLRSYPRKRLQLHMLEMVLSCYRKLLGNAPEYLREMTFCRSSLNDLHAAFSSAHGDAYEAVGPGKLILPEGCTNLDMAADVFLAGLTPDELLAFDKQLQKDTARKFKGLATVCLRAGEKGPHFRELLLTKSRAFLDAKLDNADPASVFFRFRADDQTSHSLIGEAFEEATPGVTAPAGETVDEFSLLAVPPGEEGDRFRSLVSAAIPSVEFTTAPLADDICFYREYPRLKLADLPNLGESAQEAYAKMVGAEHPPHSRLDVVWQAAGT